jgi:hypothetical protein
LREKILSVGKYEAWQSKKICSEYFDRLPENKSRKKRDREGKREEEK